jgi:putative heme-binding domain-containing protein
MMNQLCAKILATLMSGKTNHFCHDPPVLSFLWGLLIPLPALVMVPIAASEPPSSIGQAAARDAYARYAIEKHGNKDRGRVIFTAQQGTNCTRCHRADGVGGSIGPDLSNIGGKFARPHLVESVLEPSRQIVEGYRSTVLGMADGRVVTGLVEAETGEQLTLVDSEGRKRVISKSEIEQRKFSDISIMPEGLSTGLSMDQFADLIAYLESLRSAGQPTPGSGASGPVSLPAGFITEKIVGGLSAATALAIASDDRVFVCEQTGCLRVIKNGHLLPEPFVTLRVDHYWERGLIGVALDPDFSSNGFLYVTYVTSEPYPHHRISRFTAVGDIAAPGSELVLLEGDDQRKLGGSVPAGHQGGALHFGQDGKLYVAIGEQTAGSPSQSLSTFQGKLLRLNADGTIPTDNPFFAKANGKYRAIWALGLRNPFTFAVQPETGRIFINDVGQDKWEEVNEGFAGANFGWPETEGLTRDPRFRAPIHVYRVASVTGAAFCPRASSGMFPAEYQGQYFFMDFVQGWIKVLDPDHPQRSKPFATGLTRPVDLAFAPDGSLFVLQRDAWVIDNKFEPHTGSLLRIHHSSAPNAESNRHASH